MRGTRASRYMWLSSTPLCAFQFSSNGCMNALMNILEHRLSAIWVMLGSFAFEDVNYHLRFIKCHAHSQLATGVTNSKSVSHTRACSSCSISMPISIPIPIPITFRTTFPSLNSHFPPAYWVCGVKCRTTVRMSVVMCDIYATPHTHTHTLKCPLLLSLSLR